MKFKDKFAKLESEVLQEIQGNKQEKDLPKKWVALYDDLIYGKMKKEEFADNYTKLLALRKIMIENLK